MAAPRVEIALRVQFFDTDCGGVAHNLAYLRFVEAARTELLERMGFPVLEMTETQCFPVIVRAEIAYRKAARLGEELRVESELVEMDRVRFVCGFAVKGRTNGELMAEGRHVLVWVQLPQGKAVPVPDAWRGKHPELVCARVSGAQRRGWRPERDASRA
ncbi:MAG TPA: thioesterase family protein [Verrucomicrobiales bacterium]|nr:thioesterase family protein [Verrucomicrobiales bacterium]